MSDKSIYWYDFETFGKDAKRDRAAQFAGIRTDEDLNIIGEPLLLYCKPSEDFLPEPMACYITGITPQKAAEEGVVEAEFIRQILAEFSKPNTCVAGYNNIRFDDELTRQLLYRNFYDPYEREYKNGNSRWDLIDVVRLCAGVRPDGINWPLRENGSRSFRLDQLTVANGIEHGAAHDALADVIATIEMAKLLRKNQPRLFDYAYGLRSKQAVRAQLDMVNHKPVIYVSMIFPARLGCLSVVMPLCQHPTNANAIIACDLRVDPKQWLGLTPQEMASRLYKKKSELKEGELPLPLHVIASNKCPIIVPVTVLDDDVAASYELERTNWMDYYEQVKATPGILQSVSEAYANDRDESRETDPDFMIYSGFFSDSDKQLMQTVRQTPPEELARLDMPFRDKRLSEMLFRYRARNYPATLSADERARWREFCRAKVCGDDARKHFEAGLKELLDRGGAETRPLMEQLQQYADEISQSD